MIKMYTHIWKSLLSLYLRTSILNVFVESEYIANNTFTITSDSPLGDGIWQAVASCDTVFPGKTYEANQAWIVTRYGVPISNYQDYLDGNDAYTNLDYTYVVTRVGHGNSAYSLTFSLQFDYDVWLGSGVPSGDCHLFTDSHMASVFADSAPTLSDTPADPLISSAQLEITSFDEYGDPEGLCRLRYEGIVYGARETVILISFTVPVIYRRDYIGSYALAAAADSTWWIVKNSYGGQDSLDYVMEFRFSTENNDTSSAYCYLYASQEDAESAADLIGQTTTIVTITTPVVITTTSNGNDVNTDPTMTVASNQVTSVTQVENSQPSRSGHLHESQSMRNKYVHEGNLWIKETANILRCARLCLADDSCVSVFHQEASSGCTAHSVVYGNGNAAPGVKYYVLK